MVPQTISCADGPGHARVTIKPPLGRVVVDVVRLTHMDDLAVDDWKGEGKLDREDRTFARL